MIVDSSQGLTKLPRCSWFFLLTTLNWSHWNSICLKRSLTLNHSVSNQIDGKNKERNGGARVCRQPRREKKSFSTLSLIWIGFFSGREREMERALIWEPSPIAFEMVETKAKYHRVWIRPGQGNFWCWPERLFNLVKSSHSYVEIEPMDSFIQTALCMPPILAWALLPSSHVDVVPLLAFLLHLFIFWVAQPS